MNLSSTKEKRLTIEDIRTMVSGMLDEDVVSVESLCGGANSRVFLLECADRTRYAAKFYFSHKTDPRDRLGVEYTSLSFLWNHGVTRIPRPVAINPAQGCAVYTYIEGCAISAGEVTCEDIDTAVDFLAEIKFLRRKAQNPLIPTASEACFSVEAVIANIQSRLDRFKAAGVERPIDLHNFLSKDFIPVFGEVTEWCRGYCSEKKISLYDEIPWDVRTLSPSDFGFHNARRDPEGRIVFLDFEYFGWDDPVKMISDFLLHPAMQLNYDCKEQFCRGVLDLFPEDEHLRNRLRCLYPLFGLKWCMIFLNEFLDQGFERRNHAVNGSLKKGLLQADQMEKSRLLLKEIRNNYQAFPIRL